MEKANKALNGVRELLPVFVITVTVSLVSTVVGAWFEHLNQVNAESTSRKVVHAVAGPGSQQVLTIDEWGMQLVAPFAVELPILSYAGVGGSSVGISSADLETLGVPCRAENNALGAILRLPQGSFAASKHSGYVDYFITSKAGYEYVYRIEPTACLDMPGARGLVNRETSILREAMDTLAPHYQ